MILVTVRSFTSVVLACVVLISACTKANVNTAQADRAEQTAATIEPTVAQVPLPPSPEPTAAIQAGNTPADDLAPEDDARRVEPVEVSVPDAVCVPETNEIIGGLISWTDVGLDKTWTASEADVYADTAGDAGRAFLDGNLRCAITYDDGATLEISTGSNYDADQFLGNRLANESALAVEILIAVEPEIVRAVVEYPWAPSSTGVASLIVTLNDPTGIEASEVRAIEELAVRIRDETSFDPPAVQGPAYPEWYVCTLAQFATAQGTTNELAAAIQQPAGLHATETIDRGFGTAQCELNAGPGTASSGQPALGGVRIALAAYESGSPSFEQTVQGVRSQAGVAQGELQVEGVTYETVTGENSVAIIIDSQGRAVMSVFDTEGLTPTTELEALLVVILTAIF